MRTKIIKVISVWADICRNLNLDTNIYNIKSSQFGFPQRKYLQRVRQPENLV